MVRSRTIERVGSEFIDDAQTIMKLLNKHMAYLRTDVPHYKAISALNSHVVDTARKLHDGPLPWAQSSTGSVVPKE